MPRYPETTPAVAPIPVAAFSNLAGRLAACRGETYPFHVGDTWMEPPEGCRMEDLAVDRYPGMHRYAPPQGLPELLDAVAVRCSRRMGVATERQDLLISAGATGGLGTVLGAVLDPGDEVLILAPFWPLIDGIVRTYRGTPVHVPFTGVADSAESAIEVVGRYRTGRTVALYLSTPNNPTGCLIPRNWLESLVEWAARHDLWVIADDVYEDYAYAGEHAYCRSLAPERVFSVHSFSKAYGMAGNRCGYVAGPRRPMLELLKVGTHTVYNATTASQLAALRALDRSGDAWVERARALYRNAGREAAARLGVPEPQGGTFLFLDVAGCLGRGGLQRFLEDCADRGITVAPGNSFGPYPTHLRVCFTAAEPAKVSRGIALLADLLQR